MNTKSFQIKKGKEGVIMLVCMLDLMSKGVEFNSIKPSNLDGRLAYSVKIPKKISYIDRLGNRIEKTYAEIKEYVKEELAIAIGKTYTAAEQPIDHNLICIVAKIKTGTWEQEQYDEFVTDLEQELA